MLRAGPLGIAQMPLCCKVSTGAEKEGKKKKTGPTKWRVQYRDVSKVIRSTDISVKSEPSEHK